MHTQINKYAYVFAIQVIIVPIVRHSEMQMPFQSIGGNEIYYDVTSRDVFWRSVESVAEETQKKPTGRNQRNFIYTAICGCT